MIRAFASFGKKIKEVTPKEAAKYVRDPKHNVWIDFEKPTHGENEFLKSLGFHPLSVEDTIKGRQRPKIEDYDDYGYIVIRTLEELEKGGSVQMSIFLGKTFIITYSSSNVPSLHRVMEDLKTRPHVLTRGHDFLAYEVMDAIVDDFFPILEKLDVEIDSLEDEVFTKPSIGILRRLFRLKRRLLEIRRVAWPMRDVLNVLCRRDYSYIKPHTAVYFRDVYDHLLRITDLIDSQREVLTSSMEGYLSVVSNNLNFVVKRLTAITVILMVPTLLASVYGMNVINLPLAQEGRGFIEIMVIMLAFTILSLYYFKRKEWL